MPTNARLFIYGAWPCRTRTALFYAGLDERVLSGTYPCRDYQSLVYGEIGPALVLTGLVMGLETIQELTNDDAGPLKTGLGLVFARIEWLVYAG
jgi:hypothetical protein